MYRYMFCLNCCGHLTAIDYLRFQCPQCGWRIKKRKYLKYYNMLVNSNIPKCVLWNTAENRHKQEVKNRTNVPREGESNKRCDWCPEFLHLCHLCEKGVCGKCESCGREQYWSRYQSDWHCDSYECA